MNTLSPFRTLLIAGLLGSVAVSGLQACGPDFPNCYLSNSFDALTTLPTMNFEAELARWLPRQKPERFDAVGEEHYEVRLALRAQGLAERDIDALLAKYDRLAPPAMLPEEFQRYARGAVAWHQRDDKTAIAEWRALLALPPQERRYRSVWAAYMIGRVLCETDGPAAREACRLARDLAAQGFPDSQRLAAASRGWEARAYLRDHDFVAALKLYAEQCTAGDPSAVASIQLTLMHLFGRNQSERAWRQPQQDPDAEPDANLEAVLPVIAADPELRRVVTAWFAARGGPNLAWGPAAAEQFGKWIRCLPRVKDLAPEEADRWCWAAYQNGMWEEAGDLARQAPVGAPASEWVRAMLLLRAGSVDEAADHLAKAAAGFATDRALTPPADPDYNYGMGLLSDAPAAQLAGVRGVLALRREQYVEALRLFLSAQHWADAAYVAERVLTVDELVAFARSEAAAYMGGTDPMAEEMQKLRHLTARRLVRTGDFARAREFFPPEVQRAYQAYLDEVRVGFDEQQPARRRAGALWQAALAIHQLGMEIQGTELAPDYNVVEGAFQWPPVERWRVQPALARFGDRWQEQPVESDQGALAASAGEFERLTKTMPPSRRYHYSGRATELAWLSAALLPNDDPETATVLHTAGLWIAARYPEEANLFYKTLVLRCPHTELGRMVAARHWFIRNDGEQDPPSAGAPPDAGEKSDAIGPEIRSAPGKPRSAAMSARVSSS